MLLKEHKAYFSTALLERESLKEHQEFLLALSLPQHRIKCIYIVPERHLFFLPVRIFSVGVKWPEAKIRVFKSGYIAFH